MKELLVKHRNKLHGLAYATIGLLAIFLYLPAREHMIVQDAWIWIIKSNITFNFILLFFIWGFTSDRIAKSRGWKINGIKSWTLFAVGLVALILIFKFVGGYKTI